jgi:hypothetical protein
MSLACGLQSIEPEMPPFLRLSEEKRREIIAYVMHLGRQ